MSKRTLSTFIACVVLLTAAAIFFHRPGMPSQWRALRTGMTHAEVLALLGSSFHLSDMRNEKGFESVTADATIHGTAAYWQVLLRYDANNHLIAADAHFIDTVCGLFSTEFKPLLLVSRADS